MPAQDFFKVYADPRFRILTPEDKRLVLEGKLNLDQIIDLRDADTRYRNEVMSKQNAPQSPQEAPQEDSMGLWERMNPEGYKKAGATLSGFGDYAVGGAAKTIGGAAFAAGELAPMVVDPIGTLANVQDAGGKEIRSPLWTQVGRDFADTGRFEEATKTLRAAGIQEGDILESVAKTGASVAPMAGAALTRNPSLGAAVMGGSVFGQEYLEGRDALNLGKVEAAQRAGVQGAIELLTERVGLGAFYKGGLDNILTKPLKEALEKNYGSKLAGTIIANVSEELAATELQMGADEEMGYRTYTPEQKAQARMDAAVGGIVMGGGIGAVTSLQRTPSIKTGDPAIDSGAAAFAKAQEEANKRVFGKAKSEQTARDTEWAIDQSIGESIRDEMVAADSRKVAAEKLANANRIQDIFTGEETTVPTQEQRDARAEETRTPERQAELEREYLQKKTEEAKAKKATKKIPEDSPRLYDIGIPEGASPQMAEAFRQAQIRRSTDVRGENIYPNIRQPVDVPKEDAGVFEPTKPQTKQQKQEQAALPLKESTDVRPSEEYQPTLDKQQMAEEDKARAEELTNDIKKYENHLKRSKFPEAKQKWTRAIALAQSELDLINQRETTNAQDVRKASGQVPRRGDAVEGSQGEGSPNLQQQEPGRAGDGGIRGEPVGIAQDEVQRAAEEDVISPEELQQTASRIRSKTEQAVAEKAKDEKRAVITKTLRENGLSGEIDLIEDDNIDLNGRFRPSTGRIGINLNAAAINTPGDVRAVAVHEISHSLGWAVDQGKKPSRRSLSGILGSQNENIVNQRIQSLAKSSPVLQRAVRRAQASKNPEKEYLSYALEQINLARAEGKPLGRRVTQFIKDVVSYVKVGLSNAGLKNLSNSFNENDLYRLGQLMVKEQKVTKPTAESRGVLESRSEQTTTPEFKRWFGDSKVVDKNGTPRVVYHGTTSDVKNSFNLPAYFTESSPEASAYTRFGSFSRRQKALANPKFKIAKGADDYSGMRVPYAGIIDDAGSRGDVVASDEGIALRNKDGTVTLFDDLVADNSTFDPSEMSIVIRRGDGRKRVREKMEDYQSWINSGFPPGKMSGEGGNVLPVYLSIKNPKQMGAYEANRFGARLGGTKEQWEAAVEELEAQGYDGIVTESDDLGFFENNESQPQQWIPLRPEQIKSAIGNKGAFDPNNPSILESRSRPAPEKEQKKVLEPRGKEPLKQTRATPDPTGVVSIFENLLGKSSQETTESLRKQSLKKRAGRAAGKAAEATKSVLLGTEGKKMEIKSIEDIAQGLTNLASIKAANLHKRLENTFHKVVAKGSQPEVLRKLTLASDKKKETRNEARAWLRDNYPDVHDDFMAFRHAIKLNSLQYIDSILSSGKPLTRRDIAVITEIEKNLDSYITRSYRALSSDPKIKKAWVKNMKKAIDARDRGETLNEAQQKLVNIFDGAVEELKRISLSIGDYVQDTVDVPAGFKKVSLARTIALADAWLGNKAPPAPVGMTAEESEQYVETVNRMLEAKKKELEDAGMYDQALDGLAKSVAKEIVGILDKPGEIAKEYLSNVNDLTTIKKKTDITEPLRKLLGEISNPLEQLQITAMIQGEFLATANMQKELYEVGLDRGWFSDTRSDNAYTTQFKGERFGVLDGVWTTKGIYDQIAEPVEVLSFPVKMLARLNSLSKAITIKYNPANPITNFVGASVFTYAQNGYVPINPLNLKEDISSLVKAVEASYGQLYAADAEHLNRWAEEVLAVSLGDQVNIAELQADARKQLRDEILAGKSKTSVRRKVGDFATWLNAQSDKLFVYHAYFKEQAFLKKYYEAKGVERTPAQIQREAAERIKQSNITPERAPKIVRQAERFGLTRFMRYFAETARSPLTSMAVAVNDINNAIKDRKNGDTEAANMLMRRGLARLSGSMATLVFNQQIIRGMMSLGARAVPLAVLGGIPLMAASLLAGDDPEEAERQKKVDIIRKGLALDRQGKDYSYFGVDDDGNHILVERDRINPIDTFTAPVKSVMEGNWERAKEEAIGVFFANASTVRMIELAAPLISYTQGKEFKTKQEPDWAKSNPELYSVLANIPEEALKKTGLDSGQIKRGTDFVLRQLEPYTVRPLVANAQSIAEEGEGLNRFDKVEDAMASLGFYMMRFNPIRNMENTAKYEYDQVSRDAWKEIKDTISKLDIPDDRIVELYVNKKKQEMEAFDNVLGSVQAAQGLKPKGMSEADYNTKLLKSLTEAGVQKDKAAALLKGTYEEGIYSEKKWADSKKEAVRKARTASEEEAVKRRYDNLKRVINDLGVK